MTEMNKQAAGYAQVTELEKELLGNAVQEDEKLEGRRVVQSDTLYRRTMDNRNRMFSIKMGLRQRHPKRVLHDYETISSTTTNADKAWEQMFMEGQERQSLDRIYTVGGLDMMSAQLGLNALAEKNFRGRKPKLSLSTMVGM